MAKKKSVKKKTTKKTVKKTIKKRPVKKKTVADQLLSKVNTHKQPLALILIIAIVGVSALYILSDKPTTSSNVVDVEFFIMSQCPYGTQVENAFAPVLEEFGSSINFNLGFIGKVNDDGSLQSLHGQKEIDGNRIQACAQELQPEKLMDLVLCMNENAGTIPDNWQSCAKRENLDEKALQECYAGTQGQNLILDAFTQSVERQVTGSPTMYFNGVLYGGARDTAAFKLEICNQLNFKHSKCDSIQKPVEVELTILNSEDCTSCNPAQVVGASKQFFPGVTLKEVDASTKEGKALIEKYDLKLAPAYIFDSTITQTATWKSNEQLKNAFVDLGDGNYRIMDQSTGASYYLDDTERLKAFERLGITLGDNKPQIDFYVMSYCPYGNTAEEAISQVFHKFEGLAEFTPHYVIYSNYQGGGPKYCLDADSKYCSMHGITELNQNLREMCVLQEYDVGRWFQFAIAMNSKCNYENADTCWEPVATDLGLDTQTITDCFDTNAEAFAANELALNNLFGVSGSPTVFIDGTLFSGQRTADGYQKALCEAFDEKPSICDTPLGDPSVKQIVPSGACG
ncbi:hypothetical protein GOV04_01520 [Candidatus Woesearchaeota archaeon]|nr:hypothetical protein [Candidatus Woesearchaeota archaeon]